MAGLMDKGRGQIEKKNNVWKCKEILSIFTFSTEKKFSQVQGLKSVWIFKLYFLPIWRLPLDTAKFSVVCSLKVHILQNKIET